MHINSQTLDPGHMFTLSSDWHNSQSLVKYLHLELLPQPLKNELKQLTMKIKDGQELK